MGASAVAIVSGGMDSVALAYDLADHGYELHFVTFDYGQRHKKEIGYAASCAARLGAHHTIVDLTSMAPLLKGSALTDDVEVPEGHYAAPTMAITVVPNRNAVMLAIAYAGAVAEGASIVAAGMHAGDHPIYPDCRPEFISAFSEMEMVATEGHAPANLTLYTPWLNVSKGDIVKRGEELGVPWAETWSCYQGLELHCGKCGTCYERREAFEEAGVTDPTEYMK